MQSESGATPYRSEEKHKNQQTRADSPFRMAVTPSAPYGMRALPGPLRTQPRRARDTTGLAIVFTDYDHYDHFTLADRARGAALFGHRIMSLVHSNDPDIEPDIEFDPAVIPHDSHRAPISPRARM